MLKDWQIDFREPRKLPKRRMKMSLVKKCDLIINLCPECMDKFEKFMTAKFQEEEKNAEN